MKDSGREPGRKDSDKPGKAGKNDRGKRDRKLRDTLGNPFLWLVPFLLVVILGWAVFSSMFGYRTIDTSDGLTLLRDKPDTIKSITVVDDQLFVTTYTPESTPASVIAYSISGAEPEKQWETQMRDM